MDFSSTSLTSFINQLASYPVNSFPVMMMQPKRVSSQCWSALTLRSAFKKNGTTHFYFSVPEDV
jgi:hypothetical protein